MKASVLSLVVFLCAILGAQGQTYQVSLGQVTGVNIGDMVSVDVNADDNLTNAGVLSFQLSVSIPPNVSFLDVQTTSGDLANGWFLTSNVVGSQLLIAGAGTAPLLGTGRLFTIRYTAVNPGNYILSFSPISQCYFNEGNPAMTQVNGSIEVLSPPNLYVSPASAQMLIGESLNLNAYGGTAPYQLASTNASVLSVTGTQINALTQGTAQVSITDINGYTGQSSGSYEVHTFDIGIGNTSGAATQELLVPITIDNPSGASFSSGQMTITGLNTLTLNGVNTSGFLLAGFSVQTNVVGNTMVLSFASSNAVTAAASGDVLLQLRVARLGGTNSSNHTFSPNSVVFDQSLSARTSTGQVSFQGLPNLYVSPNSATMLAGETQQFTVSSGAQAPLNWQVTNPAVGSINSAGLFTALDGGFTQVTVTDALTNSATTQTITINDMELNLIGVGGYIGGEVWLPVVAGPSFNNEAIYSYDLMFSYNESQLTFQSYETTGTLSDGWFSVANENSGTIQLSAASATPFQPGGVIGFLKFAVDGLSNGQSSSVQILSSLFNQGNPRAAHSNDVISASNASCGSTGCTNPYASNYNPNAACDDGSCAFLSPPALSVNASALLQGPFDPTTGLMKDDLRVAGLVPFGEPYSALGYNFVGGGGEAILPAVLGVTGPNAIVDWVIVEIRDAANSSSIIASRAALIQRDGDIVDLDGTSKVQISAPVVPYFLSVAHRNHLQIMSATSLSPLTLDFGYNMSAPATSLYGSEATQLAAGKSLMWAGDVTFDGVLKYTGSANDRDPILVAIGGSVPTATAAGYQLADVNMDGVVKYTGSANDRDVILVNIGGSIPTAVRMAQMP